jgi:PAS domain S-box-containing protein
LKTNTGFVTDEWRQLVGYTEENEPWNFTKFLTHVNHDDHKRIKTVYWKALNSESGLNIEFRFNHPENREQWILWHAHYVRSSENKAARLLGYMINITESKQASEALRRSEERFKCLVMVNAAIVWTAAPDGRIVEDVPMWEAFTGQIPAEYKNYGWLSALHPDDREPTFTLWMDALEIKTPMEALFRLRLRDGEYYEMLSVGIPVFNVDGSVWEWVGTITEVRG